MSGMDFGVRAHDFGKLPLAELAARIAASGASYVQLAFAKALAEPVLGPGSLSPGLGRIVRREFASRGLDIAVLGCYFNMGHPDPALRSSGADHFREHLRFAADFGCRIVATETGSVRADYGEDPENGGERAFCVFMKTLEPLVEEAERTGSLVCIEPVAKHIVNSPKRAARVFNETGSRSLGAVFDPVNLLATENLADQRRIVEECFELWGDRMMVLHAKDCAAEGGKLKVVPPGRGTLDFPFLAKLFSARKPMAHVIIESCSPADLGESARRLRDWFPQWNLRGPACSNSR